METWTVGRVVGKSWSISSLIFLGIGIGTAVLLEPPHAAPRDAPAAQFSSDRAFRIVRAIAQQPHEAGSEPNRRVREHIVAELRALGLEPQVEETLLPDTGGVALHNITASIPGSSSTGTVLLVAHHDSRPETPGAADDAAGVAAILETLRALKSDPPLRNDLLVLITDGEELGMKGAQAFVDRTSLTAAETLVLNFEARGNCGPSILFETSEGNGRLIREALSASPWPVASSLSQAIYELLPNDTDLTVFKKHGFAGLNFALIDGVNDYHTPRDTPDRLSEASLQHHGSNALALARHFGKLEQPARREPNSVHFNVLGPLCLRFPGTTVLPLTVFATALFLVIWLWNVRRAATTLRGTLWGLAVFVSASLEGVGIPALIVGMGSQAAKLLGGFRGPVPWRGYAANAISVYALLLCVHWLMKKSRRGKKLTETDTRAGGIAFVLGLLWVTTISLPGATPLLQWPLFFGLLSSCAAPGARTSRARAAVAFVLALPNALLLGPLAYLLFVGMAHQVLLAVLAAGSAMAIWCAATPSMLSFSTSTDP